MQVTRRVISFGAMTALLSACVGGGSMSRPTASDAILRTAPDAGYDAWVAGFRARALGKGISAQTYDSAFRSAGFLPGVIERDRNQTEFTRSIEDYLAIAASDERVS